MPTDLQRKWIQALGELRSTSATAHRPQQGVELAVEGGAAPAPAPVPVPAAARLGGSVGAGGRNARSDVLMVQSALNLRARAGLAEDGVCGKNTIAAIRRFQQTLGLERPDGRVDPGGPTERALNGGSSTEGPHAGPSAGSGTHSKQIERPGPSADDDARGRGAKRDAEPDFPRLARRIHEATAGIGTDEEAIFAALRELKGSPVRRARLGEVYEQMFGEDLEALLRDELNDEERAKAEAAAKQKGEPDFVSLATQIHRAAEGLGTDEKAIFAALSQVRGNPAHMATLRSVYRSMFGQSLDEVLRDELSGDELKRARDDLDPRREDVPDKGFDEGENARTTRRRASPDAGPDGIDVVHRSRRD